MVQLVIGKTARGIIKDWYYTSPPNSSTKSLDWYKTFSNADTVSMDDINDLMSDPTVNNAVRTTTNAVLRNGWTLVDTTSNKVAPRLINKLKRMRIDDLLNNVIMQALIYNESYVELVRDKNLDVVKELFLLETPEMRVETDAEGHGDILGYWQVHGSTRVWFEPNEVWHFVNTKFNTSLTGFVNTQAIVDLVKTKKLIESYIKYLFDNNKFAKTWLIKNGTTAQVEMLIDGLKARQANPTKTMVVEGDVNTIGEYEPADIPTLTNYLNYIIDQIRQLLLLPPIVGGTREGSNRSGAETEFRGVFGMNISAFQKRLADDINYDLFPKMGIKGYTFKFNPIDKMDERDAIQNAIYLKGLGFTNTTIKKYLLSKGLNELDDARFAPQPKQDTSNIVTHETQNKKSVSRMPYPDNITNRSDKQTPINSQNSGTPIKTGGE